MKRQRRKRVTSYTMKRKGKLIEVSSYLRAKRAKRTRKGR